ncbi:MAG: InlB B-repeat-containing protein [Treponema sp.]|nr:InlB B-repeat-containing protein [Treponema sp.]
MMKNGPVFKIGGFFIFFLFILLAGCSDAYDSYIDDRGTTGTIIINLNGDNAHNRATTGFPPRDTPLGGATGPDLADLTFKVFLNGSEATGSRTHDAGIDVVKFIVQAGTYDIRIEFYEPIAGVPVLYATGEEYHVQVAAGENKTISITMQEALTVTFEYNDGRTVKVQAGNGDYLPKLTAPIRGETGWYEFEGWYQDDSLTDPWDFDFHTVLIDTSLYAKWIPLMDIGDDGPGGGIIFHVDLDGFPVEGYGDPGDAGYFPSYTAHYLEAAPQDSSVVTFTFEWGANNTLIQNGLSTYPADTDPFYNTIGNGRKDTQIIVAYLSTTTETNRAAQVAAAATFGSQNDWFLPSIGEWRLLYEQRGLDNINLTITSDYWSSSQISDTQAWRQIFATGNQNGKTWAFRARAIRAF